jgi:small nuclear ribonucleoprotein (snRNP)-like protein
MACTYHFVGIAAHPPALSSLYLRSRLLFILIPHLSNLSPSPYEAAEQKRRKNERPQADPRVRINEPVIVRLKWGNTEYHGTLVSVDSYMNLQLSGTEEYVDGKGTGGLGQVLIRWVIANCFDRLA